MIKRLFGSSRWISTHSHTQKYLSLSESIPSARPYQYQTTANLVNSLVVFQMCGMPFLVDNTPNFIKLAHYTGTSPILHAVVKGTFFRHFCGGETLEEVVPKIQELAKSNVGAILDLAKEADLDAIDLTGEAAQKQAALMVRSMKDCIDIASHQPDSFIAVKVTGIAPPTLLHSWTSALRKLDRAFEEIGEGKSHIDCAQFQKLVKYFPNLKTLNLEEIFVAHDLDKDDALNIADVHAAFSLFNIDVARGLVDEVSEVRKGDRPFTHEDIETASLVIEEFKTLCKYAHEKKVKMMMDAEQTYFQSAIDDIVIGLCRLYNTRIDDKSEWQTPLVYNTYQMYLKDSLDRLQGDVKRAQQEGFSYGIKLVRGAYMVSERERAMRVGQPSPIHVNLEATHKAYNAAVKFIIEQQAVMPLFGEYGCGLSLVLASHNHRSVEQACHLMEKYSIPRQGGWVSFAQLMGMQDGVTGHLADNGFRAMKYVPYGPVSVVISYLHRRAQENSTMVEAMESDKDAIKKELRLRWSGR